MGRTAIAIRNEERTCVSGSGDSMMKIVHWDTVVIAFVALFFLGMGVVGLFAPAFVAGSFGISLGSSDARTEVRAVYGGFGIAMAILLVCAAVGVSGLRPGAVLAVATALFGMAIGRLASRTVDRPSAFYPSWLYFWVELVGAALLAFAA